MTVMKQLLDLNRLADVAIAERDTDGTDGYQSTIDWTNEVRPQIVLDLIADVLRLREAIRGADEYLNVKGDPIAAHITLVNALNEEAQPDHRVCRCGHTGSVHDPAEGAQATRLGYAIEGVGRCRGSTDGGGRCPCLDFGRLMP
jgi:hypothetical protein